MADIGSLPLDRPARRIALTVFDGEQLPPREAEICDGGHSEVVLFTAAARRIWPLECCWSFVDECPDLVDFIVGKSGTDVFVRAPS